MNFILEPGVCNDNFEILALIHIVYIYFFTSMYYFNTDSFRQKC